MVFNLLTICKGQKPGFLSSKWVRAESRIRAYNIKGSIIRVSARHRATADVAVRASIPRHEGRKPRAKSRARYPNPGFLPNRTLAMVEGHWQWRIGIHAPGAPLVASQAGGSLLTSRHTCDRPAAKGYNFS
jgi:hypothetical protein